MLLVYWTQKTKKKKTIHIYIHTRGTWHTIDWWTLSRCHPRHHITWREEETSVLANQTDKITWKEEAQEVKRLPTESHHLCELNLAPATERKTTATATTTTYRRKKASEPPVVVVKAKASTKTWSDQTTVRRYSRSLHTTWNSRTRTKLLGKNISVTANSSSYLPFINSKLFLFSLTLQIFGEDEVHFSLPTFVYIFIAVVCCLIRFPRHSLSLIG